MGDNQDGDTFEVLMHDATDLGVRGGVNARGRFVQYEHLVLL
jgi:hypothetical protein